MSECYSFVVNGVPCSTEEEKPLLRYLRDELRLTSVKDGCSEGACGTCTILVDGKAVKACVLSTKRAAGKEIVTVEGLSEAEREAFVYAFGAVGAVQCGFCIPGMVMAGKALLDQNPNPTEAEIKKAIRGNVCRCTGYKKIIEGIALAGAILRGEASVDPALEEGEDYGVGARAFRTDVRDKVLGRGEYCDDLYLDGMAHASAVRSQRTSRSLSRGRCTRLSPEMSPGGSPIGVVSISCCTRRSASASPPIARLPEREPAIPIFTMQSGW